MTSETLTRRIRLHRPSNFSPTPPVRRHRDRSPPSRSCRGRSTRILSLACRDPGGVALVFAVLSHDRLDVLPPSVNHGRSDGHRHSRACRRQGKAQAVRSITGWRDIELAVEPGFHRMLSRGDPSVRFPASSALKDSPRPLRTRSRFIFRYAARWRRFLSRHRRAAEARASRAVPNAGSHLHHLRLWLR